MNILRNVNAGILIGMLFFPSAYASCVIEGEVIGGAATPTYQIYWVSEEGTYDTYYTFGSTSPSVMMFMSSMAGTDRKIYVRSDAGYCAENGYGYNNGFSGLISVVYTAVPPQP